MALKVDVETREEEIRSSGGVRISIRSWSPPGVARALVLIIPGFNAHSGNYAWVAEQLNAAGLAVYAVDLRGRGQSDGERFYVDSFADYVMDAAAALEHARSNKPTLPTFLVGHSAGGIVACLFAIERPSELAGLICESSTFELPAPGLALAALRGLSRILPKAHVVRLKNEDFSRDPEVVRSMGSDPLIKGEVQPAQTIAELARADERLKTLTTEITLPVLILHGTTDKASKPSGSRHFYETVGSIDKTLKTYDGYFHDLLHDDGKELVVADIAGWISRHL